jgi:hypothetical protein
MRAKLKAAQLDTEHSHTEHSYGGSLGANLEENRSLDYSAMVGDSVVLRKIVDHSKGGFPVLARSSSQLAASACI